MPKYFTEFAICSSSITHLVCIPPPLHTHTKFCITFVPKRNQGQCLCILGGRGEGGIKVYYGRCANGKCAILKLRLGLGQ